MEMGEFRWGESYKLETAASMLDCSVSTLRRKIKSGELGCFRLGERGHLRVSGAHLANFLEAHVVREVAGDVEAKEVAHEVPT